MFRFFKEVVTPAGMLASLIIGAGMFSLPFVFARSGAITAAIYLIIMAFMMNEVHRSYAEIIEAAGDEERFAGYAGKYLGMAGKTVGGLAVIAGLIISLTIYLTLSASFIHLVFPAVPMSAAVICFWVIGAVLSVAGIRSFAGLDTIFFIGIAAIVGVIVVMGSIFGDFNAIKLFPTDTIGIFLPLAPVLFSLSGRSAISSIKEYFKERRFDEKNFKRAISLGSFFPIIVYAAFVVGVTMLSPEGVAADAVSGMTVMPVILGVLIGVLGFLALITSYVFLGMELRGIFERDLKVPSVIAAISIVSLPIVLYFMGFNNFLWLISLAGGLFLAIESIMVIMMRRVATRKRRAIDIFLIAILLSAIIYEIARFGA